MAAGTPEYDVAIVGASIAGCASAAMLARSGARVALLERRSDPAAFKRVCGHYVQRSAVPVLDRLGLLGELERRGAPRGLPRIWVRDGWIDPPRMEPVGGASPDGSISVRREVLDPLLRDLAASTPGVDLLLGHTLERLEVGRGGARAAFRRGGGGEAAIGARLVVGADGRGSRTAALAGIRTRTSVNRRFGYWSYFEGPGLSDGASVQIWFTEPDVAIVTPTDGGLTLYAAFPHLSRLADYKRDTEAALRAFFGRLPDAPPIAASHRVGPIVGKIDLTNEWRRPVSRGVALVGDAALAADPVGAVGCGWALQSAAWLADSLSPALAGERSVAGALRSYRRRHRRGLLGHSLVAADAARARPPAPPERLMLSAATRDPVLATRVEAFASRSIGPADFLTPGALARAARVNLAARRARPGPVPV